MALRSVDGGGTFAAFDYCFDCCIRFDVLTTSASSFVFELTAHV
jgi:hypothetical protein